MKVYLLFSGVYSQRSCAGVFSTLEKAQGQHTGVKGWEPWPKENPRAWESISGSNSWSDSYDIEEHEVDA